MPGWYESRFIEASGKVATACEQCGRAMWFPPSKAGKYLTCGNECAAARIAAGRAARTRACLGCGQPFLARAVQLAAGQGNYCSHKCAAPVRAAALTPEVIAKRVASRAEGMRLGRWAPAVGAEHASWKGGEAEMRRRRKVSGKAAATLRRYRRDNPDKVREFAKRRQLRKLGRLPRGTINRIGGAQRWRCAVCRVSIRKAFHVDHVTPLARGGEHAPHNLQLLCGHCNVTKGAKDPVAYMQERGFLL